MNKTIIGFGGGCHWCTEAVFNSLVGVEQVTQGFIRSTPPADTLSEAVQLSFNPDQMPLAILIEIHLRTHSSMSDHALRQKYRSAVYTTSDALTIEAVEVIQRIQSSFLEPLVTQVLPLSEFNPSPDHYQQYYQKHAEGAFCQRFVDPKLALIREEFSEHVLRT